MLGDGICECLWLGDNDVTLSMVNQSYHNFNTRLVISMEWISIEKSRSNNGESGSVSHRFESMKV
jgi:hypothetical protein